MKNAIITILAILVIALGGYVVYDKVGNNNEAKENENLNDVTGKAENSNLENDEIPLFIIKLNSITYHFEGDGISTFEKIITDNNTIKEVLSIIKDKQETTLKGGLGGAFNRYLLLKYDDVVEIKITMPYGGGDTDNGLISINGKYYNVSNDAYAKIESIFGYYQ